MKELCTARLVLRLPQPADAAPLLRHLQHPDVSRWWHGYDAQRVWEELIAGEDEETTRLVIERTADAQVAGLVQFTEHSDPDYRHAGIDLFLGPEFQRQGLGQEAIRAVVEYLIDERHHHRLVIDPAVTNERARATYARVGFRLVGVMREYERGADGTWHDGALMELLARDYVR
ncbi:GNAT family N-acetyltransferase [Archangium violaceum]|uniref:GNAT family N-acetyltransferase n=1 Tax=Archangium violaceum TaxID=83451 RepID=UPI002B2B0F75|nr:GNAT family N-acetyltransferase [Archangium violaceum]